MIWEGAFADCSHLEQVVFDSDSAVTEIQYKAFCNSSLESFVAPPSLRKIGVLAFRECRSLKTFSFSSNV